MSGSCCLTSWPSASTIPVCCGFAPHCGQKGSSERGGMVAAESCWPAAGFNESIDCETAEKRGRALLPPVPPKINNPRVPASQIPWLRIIVTPLSPVLVRPQCEGGAGDGNSKPQVHTSATP